MIYEIELEDGRVLEVDVEGDTPPTVEDLQAYIDANPGILDSIPIPTDSAPVPSAGMAGEGGGGGMPALYEAIWPRTARAVDDGRGILGQTGAAALDVLSLPGRGLATAIRGPAEGETYGDAMARTGGVGGDPGVTRVADEIVRDPINTALAMVPGGLLARGGALASRALPAAAPTIRAATLAGSLSPAGRLAGRVASRALPMGAVAGGLTGLERSLDGEEGIFGDVALTTAAATGAEALASLVGPAGRSLRRGATGILRQQFKPGRYEVEGFREAMDAGLLPEFAGYGTMTPAGAGERFIGRLERRAARYRPALEAADATGRRVDMRRALDEMRDELGEVIAGGEPVSPEGMRGAANWARDVMVASDDPTVAREVLEGVLRGERAPAYSSIRPSVANRRKSGLWAEAFKGDPEMHTARSLAARAGGRALRRQIDEISPELAKLNQEMGPWYAAEPVAQRVVQVRGNNYVVGPMELWAAMAGGAGGAPAGITGGIGGAAGGALLARAMRSPAAARALWDLGGGLQRFAPVADVFAAPVAASAQGRANRDRQMSR